MHSMIDLARHTYIYIAVYVGRLADLVNYTLFEWLKIVSDTAMGCPWTNYQHSSCWTIHKLYTLYMHYGL